jgi:hypothetical protein
MDNPWTALPTSAPYVLPQDAPIIDRFNLSSADANRYHLEILPEPFLGRPDANVVLLSLNPGYSPEEERFHHLDSYFRNAALTNLRHRQQRYPFYFLDPAQESPGHRWWRLRLGALIARYGAEVVASQVLCLEYFPYHSARFDTSTPRIPSQEYNFELLRRALDRGATVVAMRALRNWQKAVPELADRTFSLNSAQAVYVSPRNCPEGFLAVCDRLERGRIIDGL